MSTQLTIYKYQLYCNDEAKMVFGFGTQPPTCCYNDTAHNINPNSISEVEAVSTQIVSLKLEDIPTGGHYGSSCFAFDAAPNTTTVFQTSFPMPTTMLTAQMQASADMVGDIMDFNYAQDTIVGAIIAPVSVGDTTFVVSPTVLQYAKMGFYLNLTDGSNVDYCHRIINIDYNNSTVTCETPTDHSFSPLSPTYVRVTRYFIRDYLFTIPGFHKLGFSKIGGGLTPANTIGRCIYQNNSGVTKKVAFMIEYFY
jgi:hypothetical protein